MKPGEYLCDKCGGIHKHKKYMFGSAVDYDCKKGAGR